MSQSKFNAMFLNAEKSSVFNASTWNPVGDAYSLQEVWDEAHPGLYDEIDGDEATVTETTFNDGSTSKRISVPFKDGSSIELKLSGRSNLNVGDQVKVSSIKAQQLHKAGNDDIVRYDGERA